MDIIDLENLKEKYDRLQLEYGAVELDSIYNGGCSKSQDICFVFMNLTSRILSVSRIGMDKKLLGLELKIFGIYFMLLI